VRIQQDLVVPATTLVMALIQVNRQYALRDML
jgi:hypothetical protein